jgi:hypothetical protein
MSTVVELKRHLHGWPRRGVTRDYEVNVVVDGPNDMDSVRLERMLDAPWCSVCASESSQAASEAVPIRVDRRRSPAGHRMGQKIGLGVSWLCHALPTPLLQFGCPDPPVKQHNDGQRDPVRLPR